ncbi:MAG: hypothetical protein BEN19_07640 [Epulopiscium sp. Nuni2H_MBin003]|nr:MAG: hypothetical protein BEN19_07640 [Epulopiscium sp. Nuni2H_MBin003]
MKNLKFSIIDIAVILAFAVIVAVGIILLGQGSVAIAAKTVQIEVIAEIASVDKPLIESIGLDQIYLTVDNVDTATITNVELETYQETIYNKYSNSYELVDNVNNKYNGIITFVTEVTESDMDFMRGSTKIKVGLPVYIKGKGYSARAYIIEMRVIGGGEI